jgi:excisionase family DNA binding protein
MKTTNEPQEEGFVNKADLAKRLGLKNRTIDNWMNAGFIPYMKIGKTVRFYWPEVKKSLLKLQIIKGED